MKNLILILLLTFVFGCTNALPPEHPWSDSYPKYYFRFAPNNYEAIGVEPGRDVGCIGVFRRYIWNDDDIRFKIKYVNSNPDIVKCDSEGDCYKYPKCKDLSEDD